MQRFSSREDVLLGYSPRKTLMDPSSSPETPRTSSDIDFDDVFGGPPRQPSSIQDTRYGFGENNSDSSFTFGRSDEPVRRNPLSSLSEKPVFGEEVIARRRRWKSDFFDDIFRGKVSLSSSPKKYEMKDPFAPGLQLLKPAARPFPPEAEPSGNSFPAYSRQPSLPAKINKLMDLPTFRSFTRTKPKSNDISSNGLSYYASSPMYVGSEIKGNSNEDLSSSEISKNGTQFHFSIHKWANKGGIPIAIPLRGNDRLNGKGKLQRCSSANGWIEKEQKDRLDNRFCSIDEMSSNFKSFGVEHGKNGNVGSVIDSRNEDGQLGRIIEEDHMSKSESEIMNKHKSTVDKVSQGEVTTVGKATPKPQPKPLNVLLNEDDNDDELGNDKITRNPESKDMTEMSSEKLSEILDNTNSKKQGVKKKVTSNKVEASTRSIKHFPRKSWDNGKARVRGKVKELIKMFNQDASSKPKMDAAVSENHGSSGKERNTVKPETEPNISTSKIHPNNVLKKKSYSDIPVSSHMYNGASEKNIDGSVKDTVSDGSKTIVEEPEELFEDNFLVEDVTPEVEILPESGIDPEETKAIDNKIRQWSNGKQSNIRSLLSTLQYVLWPNSGWKPVPLVDIIEGLAVKRAYQKALLCLHPDKLQQKGAASDQKYIAQQVFDILQLGEHPGADPYGLPQAKFSYTWDGWLFGHKVVESANIASY